MADTPYIRRGIFINQADLFRATPRRSTASELAAASMGAGNVLRGASNRKPASTYCNSCHRWHRPGTPCPNSLKAIDVSVMMTKGNRIIQVQSGNPNRDDMGRFSGAPKSGKSGAEGAPKGRQTPALQAGDIFVEGKQLQQGTPERATYDAAERKGADPAAAAAAVRGPMQPTEVPQVLQPPQQAQQAQPQQGYATPQSGFSQGQAMGQGLDQPGATTQPTLTSLRQSPTMFGQQPQVQKPSTPGEQQQQFVDQSQHLQNQQQGYFDRLRQWLAGFTRNQSTTSR